MALALGEIGDGLKGGADVDVLSVAPHRKLNRALGRRKERVVAPDSDVLAGIELGTALANQDISRDHALAAEALDAQALGIGIAPIASRAGAFFGGKELKIKAEHSRVSIAGRLAKMQAR